MVQGEENKPMYFKFEFSPCRPRRVRSLCVEESIYGKRNMAPL